MKKYIAITLISCVLLLQACSNPAVVKKAVPMAISIFQLSSSMFIKKDLLKKGNAFVDVGFGFTPDGLRLFLGSGTKAKGMKFGTNTDLTTATEIFLALVSPKPRPPGDPEEPTPPDVLPPECQEENVVCEYNPPTPESFLVVKYKDSQYVYGVQSSTLCFANSAKVQMYKYNSGVVQVDLSGYTLENTPFMIAIDEEGCQAIQERIDETNHKIEQNDLARQALIKQTKYYKDFIHLLGLSEYTSNEFINAGGKGNVKFSFESLQGTPDDLTINFTNIDINEFTVNDITGRAYLNDKYLEIFDYCFGLDDSYILKDSISSIAACASQYNMNQDYSYLIVMQQLVEHGRIKPLNQSR